MFVCYDKPVNPSICLFQRSCSVTPSSARKNRCRPNTTTCCSSFSNRVLKSRSAHGFVAKYASSPIITCVSSYHFTSAWGCERSASLTKFLIGEWPAMAVLDANCLTQGLNRGPRISAGAAPIDISGGPRSSHLADYPQCSLCDAHPA